MIRIGKLFLITALAYALSHTFAEPAAYGASADMSTRNRIKIRKKSHLERETPDDSEEYSLEKMELLNSKRRALILDIRRFIREARDNDQKAELNLRLGSLYMEDYRSNLAKAQQVFETQNQTSKETGKGKPKFDSSEAMASLEKARAIYKDLVARFPKHPRRDEMFYFLAISAMDKGKIDEGMAFFKRLSNETPNSRYTNDALVQLGDYHFDANQFPQAETYYDRIIQKKFRALMPYATYKKGWCEYNGGKPANALALFKWVVQNEDANEESGGSTTRIKNEVLKDITLPFVDLKIMDEAVAFFKGYGDPYYRKGVEDMASLYYEAGAYDNAIKLYDLLLAHDPNYFKNPSYDISVVEAYKLKHDENNSLNRLFARLPAYLQNSNWYEINSTQPKAIQDAVNAFEETAWKYGVQYHAEAQRTKNEELYGLARKLYTKYLEFFPNNPRAGKVRFSLAEIQYKQSRYVEAAGNYFKVYKDPISGNNLRNDAIRSALMSLDRQLNLDRKKAGLSEINSKQITKLKDNEDASLELIAYSEVEAKFIMIGTEYLRAYPKAKDAPDVTYEQAYLQYLHHEFAPAYANFWIVVNDYVHHPTAYGSSYLILDILNRRKDYSKLVQACKKLMSLVALALPTFRTDVSDILRRAELKKIQIAEENGNFKEAADSYLDYVNNYGHEDENLFEKALYNASVDYTKAHEYLKAVETQEKFLRRFKNSPLRETMFLQVAKTYEIMANFEKAASYFELFSSTYPKNAQSKNALRLAGLYYWGSGNSRKAESVITTYMRMYPADRKVAEKDLLDIYETAGASEKEVAYYLQARAERGIPISDYVTYSLKIAELSAQRNGRIPTQVMEEALHASQKNAKDLAQTPKGVEAMSKLMFWYANRREQMFYNIKLAVNQSQMEANLQRKIALLKEIERDYQRVASLGSGDWGLGSIFKTASAYHTLAQDIVTAPVPSELTAEQVDQYRKEIEKTFVKPFNEKAMNLAAQCLDKAQEFNLLSMWTPKCYSVLSELDPSRYPMIRTFYLPAMQLSLMMPNKKISKVNVGNVKNYAYPFFSFGLFNPASERNTASFADPSAVFSETRGINDAPGVVPGNLNYRVLAKERKEILTKALNGERPTEDNRATSFAYLNLLRLVSPQRAVPLILEAIQHDPSNNALHNLLGLTYLEQGNFPAAKVTWLSMMARGVKSAALYNNLGVLANMQLHERQAVEYFTEAAAMEEPKEALNNLGFVALKYRNGSEAKKQFEKAIGYDKDEVITQVGLAISQLQNRELDSAKDKLIDLSRKYKNDPYARLSLGYYLIDVEKEYELAKKLLSEYMESQGLENDLTFRQALQESRRQVAGGGELPSIPQ